MTAPADPPGANPTGVRERRRRYRKGLTAEWVAAALLLARGYRILARRYRTHSGEIDLITVRGRTLAFVEVKRRRDELATESALSPRQRQRVRRAADIFVGRNPRFSEYDRRFDIVFVLPRRWPRHVPGGL
jgi:putative endonuclease